MKKKIAMMLSLVMIVMTSMAIGAYAATTIKLYINGKSISADVKLINNTTYVPLRVVSENLGADVKWDQATKTVTINSGSSASTGGGASGGTSGGTSTSDSSLKSYPVNIDITSGPMKMHISKVTLNPAYKQYETFSKSVKVLVLDVTVENTSDDFISWSPPYGVLITNTKEQAQGYQYSDGVGGDFMGNVVKTGQLRFALNGDLDAISSFKLTIDRPIGDYYESVGEETATNVVFK